MYCSQFMHALIRISVCISLFCSQNLESELSPLIMKLWKLCLNLTLSHPKWTVCRAAGYSVCVCVLWGFLSGPCACIYSGSGLWLRCQGWEPVPGRRAGDSSGGLSGRREAVWHTGSSAAVVSWHVPSQQGPTEPRQIAERARFKSATPCTWGRCQRDTHTHVRIPASLTHAGEMHSGQKHTQTA